MKLQKLKHSLAAESFAVKLGVAFSCDDKPVAPEIVASGVAPAAGVTASSNVILLVNKTTWVYIYITKIG